MHVSYSHSPGLSMKISGITGGAVIRLAGRDDGPQAKNNSDITYQYVLNIHFCSL